MAPRRSKTVSTTVAAADKMRARKGVTPSKGLYAEPTQIYRAKVPKIHSKIKRDTGGQCPARELYQGRNAEPGNYTGGVMPSRPKYAEPKLPTIHSKINCDTGGVMPSRGIIPGV